jgi:hypothetical protein
MLASTAATNYVTLFKLSLNKLPALLLIQKEGLTAGRTSEPLPRSFTHDNTLIIIVAVGFKKL